MTRLKTCPGCNRLIPVTSKRCASCSGNTSWNGARDRGAQARFRAAVGARAGWQCEHVDGDGVRCQVIRPLEAHHTQPGNDDPATGEMRCRAHHKLVDTHAR